MSPRSTVANWSSWSITTQLIVFTELYGTRRTESSLSDLFLPVTGFKKHLLFREPPYIVKMDKRFKQEVRETPFRMILSNTIHNTIQYLLP